MSSANELAISLDYYTSIMSDSHASSLAASFTKVLNTILGNETRRLSDFSVVSDGDLTQNITDQYSAPAVDDCTHWQISRHIRSHPEAQAVASWDGDLTYIELGFYASRLAARLEALGVGPEVLVLLCFPKSTWAVVAMVAVQMAGGAFVPLDPNAPRKRIESILEDTKSTLALVAPSCEEVMSGLGQGVRTLVVNELTVRQFPLPSVRSLASSVMPDNASFVIFTSGSTGRPKGMVMQHNGICSTAAGYGAELHIGLGTRVFQFSTYTFDVGVWDVLITLMRGGCVCVPDRKSVV